jgi:hypothetical protein
MQNEERNRSNNNDPNNKMPEKVLNTAVDPESIKDPLEEQLEKSKHMNTASQNAVLEDVKRRNRESENERQ